MAIDEFELACDICEVPLSADTTHMHKHYSLCADCYEYVTDDTGYWIIETSEGVYHDEE